MKILGIDPSINCTGWCFIDQYHMDVGSIKTDPKHSTLTRIIDIVDELEVRFNDEGIDYVFIESEAYGAKSSSLIQLCELMGALKVSMNQIAGLKSHVLTYTPSQARKMILGGGTIPVDKKDKKTYIDYIKSKIATTYYKMDYGYDSTDIYDAIVLAKAGEMETFQPSLSDHNLITMRLHDEKILTKNNKKIYSYGKGKSKVTFKDLSKVDKKTFSELMRKYESIFGQTI